MICSSVAGLFVTKVECKATGFAYYDQRNGFGFNRALKKCVTIYRIDHVEVSHRKHRLKRIAKQICGYVKTVYVRYVIKADNQPFPGNKKKSPDRSICDLANISSYWLLVY